MQVQPGDDPAPVMSFLGHRAQHPRQVDCHITATNEACHEIIRGALDRSPMYAGVIEGAGPRYCPSIEDKVTRFADKASHQIFVEPEGLDVAEVYPNGISTSLPFDAQVEMVRCIRGFECAHITRPGYAIEYDFFDPRDPALFAGKASSSRGCISPARSTAPRAMRRPLPRACSRGSMPPGPWPARNTGVPRRDQAYIGVLVDDLIRLGASEPYRMFTSRAEYRLSLREDNADERLTAIGRDLKLVDDERWRFFNKKQESMAAELARLRACRVLPGSEAGKRLASALERPLSREQSLAELLARPELSHARLMAARRPGMAASRRRSGCGTGRLEQLEIQLKYHGYIERQRGEIEKLRRQEDTVLPSDLDYAAMPGLSNELRQKLAEARPENLGRAARIPGMTPAALSLILVYLKKAPAATAQGELSEHGKAAPAGDGLPASLQESLLAGSAAVNAPLTEAAAGRLLDYLRLLDKWNASFNLSGVTGPGEMLDRHLLDSLSVAPWIRGDSGEVGGRRR